MKFRDLQIETQREAPSNARTAGFAFLVRAGYKTRDGAETALGLRALWRLQDLAEKPEDFFAACRLPIVKADGNESLFSIPGGRVQVVQCTSCDYAARVEIARIRKQTQALDGALPIEKVRTPNCDRIDSLASFLGIPKEKTAKALMFTRMVDGKFVFVTVRGDMQVNEAKLAKLVGEIRPASRDEIAAAGCVPGYASAIGLKGALIVVDDLIPQSENLAAGANEEGYHWKNTNYERDYLAEIVADLVRAQADDPCPNCGNPLALTEGEVLADAAGYRFSNILAGLAEVHHDAKGLTLPPGAAPFDIHLLQLSGKLLETKAKAEELYGELLGAGLSVLFDDRDERAGVKFNDADLIGCPIRVTVGEKNLKNGMVELKPRTSSESSLIAFTDAVRAVELSLKSEI